MKYRKKPVVIEAIQFKGFDKLTGQQQTVIQWQILVVQSIIGILVTITINLIW